MTKGKNIRYLELNGDVVGNNYLQNYLRRWGVGLTLAFATASYAAQDEGQRDLKKPFKTVVYSLGVALLARKFANIVLTDAFGTNKVIDTLSSPYPRAKESDIKSAATSHHVIKFSEATWVGYGLFNLSPLPLGVIGDLHQMAQIYKNVTSGKWRLIDRDKMNPAALNLPKSNTPPSP